MHQVPSRKFLILFNNFSTISSSTCEFSTGVLPFNTLNPGDVDFEPFADYFGKPLTTLELPLIGDTIKISCVQQGEDSINGHLTQNNYF